MSEKLTKHSESLCVGAVTFLLLSALVFPSPSYARPFPGGPGPGPRGPAFRPHAPRVIYPRPGFRIKVLPREYLTLQVGALTYFFLDGIFYRPGVDGYMVVPAPMGARIITLPANAVIVSGGDTLYYSYAGVYYQKVDGGYMVVTKPETTVQTAVQTTTDPRSEPDPVSAREGDQVRVTAASLNVRSGPGKEHKVLCQVRRGDLLKVQASNSDWYYVLLGDGSLGWVMIKYTTKVASEAVG
ncbi:DUF6515 family protein [Desulfoplanes sp.]